MAVRDLEQTRTIQEAVTGIHTAIAAGALGLALAASTSVEWCALREPPRARFWFDSPAFQLPRPTEQLSAGLTPADMQQIERVARLELSQAFAGLRLVFSDHPASPYQVRVVQDLPPRLGPRPLAVGESVVLGPLGSQGWVSFRAVTSFALSYAPAHASRASVIDSIGRGIGRVAAHEFAHQILTNVDLHASRDPNGYEYASADRETLFYGRLAWSFVGPLLAEKLHVNGAEAATGLAAQTR
jgi:hypothetical protein